jgi:2-haloacid dehalogenase
MVKGIFFDLGGTLYSYGTMGQSTLTALDNFARRINHPMSALELAGEYQLANKVSDQRFAPQPFYLFKDYFESTFIEFINRIGCADQAHQLDWFIEQHTSLLLDNLALQPDCHQTLEDLKSRGLYVSVVSNSDEDQLQPLIEKAGIAKWLDHWTSSEAAQSCKPDARFFELALEKSGLSPEEVVFVGDSLEQDIAGASRIGMTTVLITETDTPAPMHLGTVSVQPDHNISRLGELVPIIDKLR